MGILGARGRGGLDFFAFLCYNAALGHKTPRHLQPIIQ